MSSTPQSIPRIYGRSDQEYQRLLSEIADNLLSLTPSQFVESDILELERILNELYVRAYLDSWSLNIQDAVLEALSRASELSHLIQKQNGPLERAFFRTLKQFAPILYMLSTHLECNQDNDSLLKVTES